MSDFITERPCTRLNDDSRFGGFVLFKIDEERRLFPEVCCCMILLDRYFAEFKNNLSKNFKKRPTFQD